ncbi:hypothetical protein SOVF_134180 [Spinacia oleracea]|uniref:RAB6-interacting golgin n=1 Tax=Spinacia oleracea TaxID=3562 RepID=A0A9R0K9F9_SPIOL|nr:uncharacterized protein LOC110802231 [Spinacia oleracea]KNA11456.1 hypothetical protein SOVF_134180 [Spinacia oleracea]
MANCAIPNEGLKDLLKPFYQRASEAEDRLSIIENVISSKKEILEAGNEECSEKVKELELKLEEVTAQLAAEKEKVAKLTVENCKKDYRMIHLVRSVKEVDLKLEQLTTK